MPKSQSFTQLYEGTVNVLQSSCYVCEAYDPATPPDPPLELKPFSGIWDTGATGTVITQRVVDECGLAPTGMVMVHGVAGVHPSETYLVNVMMPHGVGVPKLRVTKGVLPAGCDLLLGMDIISVGDFAITNKDGKTAFSFRLPSERRINFVDEHHEMERQEQRAKRAQGSKRTSRPNRHKSYGKNKHKK